MADNNKNKQIGVEVEVEVEQPTAMEELLVKIPATMVHLIDNRQSVELAYGDLEIILVRQNESAVAVLARIRDQIQWPLTKDQAALKLDDSHYFFTLNSSNNNNDTLNYGVTIPWKGQEELLKRLDEVLDKYSGYKEERVSLGEVEDEERWWWWKEAREVGPEEVERDKERRDRMEESAAAYWTTLAPNVEEYSSGIARMIVAGSGMVVKGILWCGDVTVERLKWGEEFLRTRMESPTQQDAQVSPITMERIERVKSMTIKSEQLATGLLSGVIKVSHRITGTIVNSAAGRRFFNMLPGEIVLASFDAYNQVWDAVEAAGKNVMSTSSQVTTELVTQRYGEEAARATNQGMHAAGHAIATVWTVFKIAKALNPKSALKPTSLAKAAVSKPKKLA